MSAALPLGGKYILVQDDPDLVARAAAHGLKVIYRQSGDETLSLDPAAFVNERAKNAPAAAYIHLTNELDVTPDLLRWTIEGINYANSINRRLVILNYSTHRTANQWKASVDVIQRALADGHGVGVHVYSSHPSDPDALRYLPIKRQTGGVWLCTEFGYALDAYHGWRGTLSEQQYADFCRAWLPTFAAENMPVLLFSYDHWTANAEGKAHGFGVNDAPTFLSALAGLNAQYPLKEGTPVPPTPYPPRTPAAKLVNNTGIRLRPAPSLSNEQIRYLTLGEAVTVYAQPSVIADGYSWVRVLDSLGNNGWAADPINGVPSFVDAAPVPPTLRLKSPLPGGIITARFNEPRSYGRHEGTDWALAPNPCAIGTVHALAAADGIVDSVRDFPTAVALDKLLTGYGIYVRVKHVVGADVYYTWCGHLSALLVCKGQAVKQGDPIGILGTSGNSTGYHVHLTVQHIGHGLSGYVIEDVVDPEPLLIWVSAQGGNVLFEPVGDPAPAPVPTPLIIDVSSNNGKIDWVRVKADGVREAYIRATMGGAGVDTSWHFNSSAALAAGIDIGYYHLFRPDSDGIPQAQHVLRKVNKQALPLAVDVERVVAPTRVLTKDQYADQLAAFVQHIKAETGEFPTVYTSYGEWGALVGRKHDALFAQCELWVANYTTRPQPTLPRCWSTYALWQFTSSGRVDGIPSRVDLNRL